jgi:hypothetical protein
LWFIFKNASLAASTDDKSIEEQKIEQAKQVVKEISQSKLKILKLRLT